MSNEEAAQGAAILVGDGNPVAVDEKGKKKRRKVPLFSSEIEIWGGIYLRDRGSGAQGAAILVGDGNKAMPTVLMPVARAQGAAILVGDGNTSLLFVASLKWHGARCRYSRLRLKGRATSARFAAATGARCRYSRLRLKLHDKGLIGETVWGRKVPLFSSEIEIPLSSAWLACECLGARCRYSRLRLKYVRHIVGNATLKRAQGAAILVGDGNKVPVPALSVPSEAQGAAILVGDGNLAVGGAVTVAVVAQGAAILVGDGNTTARLVVVLPRVGRKVPLFSSEIEILITGKRNRRRGRGARCRYSRLRLKFSRPVCPDDINSAAQGAAILVGDGNQVYGLLILSARSRVRR